MDLLIRNVPPDVLEAFRAAARTEGCTQAELLRRLLLAIQKAAAK